MTGVITSNDLLPRPSTCLACPCFRWLLLPLVNTAELEVLEPMAADNVQHEE